jgi:TolA-binding protein
MQAATPAPPTIQPEPRAAAPEPVPIDAGGAAISQEMPTPAAGAPDSRVNEPVPGPHRSVSNPLPPSALALWTQTRDWIAAAKKEFLQLPLQQRWLAGGAAGTMLCLVLAWILVPLLRTSPIIQPATGTARVRPERAALYKEANLDSTIATLVRDDQVNVLTIPNTGDRMVHVQPIGRRVLRPGYMRISDLTKWGNRVPEASLSLILMSASDDDNKFAKLQQLTGQYPGTSTAHKAQLEMAKIDLNAVQQMKDGGQLAPAWHDRLESARTNLELAKSEPSVNGDVEDLQRKIDGLVAGVPPDLQRAGTEPAVSANTLPVQPRKVASKPANNYARGQDLYNEGKLGEAEKVLEAIPPNENDYQNALDLLRRIKAEQILQKY